MKTVLSILGTVLVLGSFATVLSLYIAIGAFIVSGYWGVFINVLLVGLVPVVALFILLLIPSKYYKDWV